MSLIFRIDEVASTREEIDGEREGSSDEDRDEAKNKCNRS